MIEKILNYLFGPPPSVEPEKESVLPKVGEEWIERSTYGDPWGRRKTEVIISDIKSGWIRYYFKAFPKSTVNDYRIPVDLFVGVYQLNLERPQSPECSGQCPSNASTSPGARESGPR